MIDLITLISKEVYRFLRIWKQTLLPPIITIVLYLLIFGKFIGEKITIVEGASYIDFIFPWLLMMSVIMASYGNTSGSFFWAKFQKSIEELFVSPMSSWKILLGFILGWMLRWVLVWLLIFITWSFMTEINIHSYFYMFVFIILTSAVFSLAWLFNWIFAKSFDDINVIPSFIITPLIYLGWVFYPLTLLSPFWQTVSQFNPILYMVNGLRYAFIWPEFTDIKLSVAIWILFIFIFILTFLNIRLLNKWYGIKS